MSKIFCAMILSSSSLFSQPFSHDRYDVSVILSGYVLAGFGYTRVLDERNAVSFGAYPLIVPAQGFPFAFDAGYSYLIGENDFKAKLGAGFALIVSPPDPDRRKTLWLINLSPGARYDFGEYSFSSEIWLSYFLGKSKTALYPTGIKFQWSGSLY
ncbi:hypothetical protein JW890_00575 [candidate division WOR-3 bacterium]|nr:hypothetical protein [candidate division WOR-3 bacterium]